MYIDARHHFWTFTTTRGLKGGEVNGSTHYLPLQTAAKQLAQALVVQHSLAPNTQAVHAHQW